jgi:hypothetical protein
MRRQKVTTLNLLFDRVSRADIRRFHAAGFKVSLVYPPKESAFYYEDIGLDQMWTDYAAITVPSLRRKSQQWNNWADAMLLPADQRHTWQDPDGDGRDNLTEYALGTDPLHPDIPLAPDTDFLLPGTNTRNPTATSLDWTVDLRENWSQFLTVTPQSGTAMDAWSDLPLTADSYTELNPTRLLFKFPVNSSKKKFYRLRFDVKQ